VSTAVEMHMDDAQMPEEALASVSQLLRGAVAAKAIDVTDDMHLDDVVDMLCATGDYDGEESDGDDAELGASLAAGGGTSAAAAPGASSTLEYNNPLYCWKNVRSSGSACLLAGVWVSTPSRTLLTYPFHAFQGSHPLANSFKRQADNVVVTTPVLKELNPELGYRGNTDASSETMFSLYKREFPAPAESIVEAVSRVQAFVQRKVAVAGQKHAGMHHHITATDIANASKAAAQRVERTPVRGRGGGRDEITTPITAMASLPASIALVTTSSRARFVSPDPAARAGGGEPRSEWGRRGAAPRGLQGTNAAPGEPPESPEPAPPAARARDVDAPEMEAPAKVHDAWNKMLRTEQREVRAEAAVEQSQYQLAASQDLHLRATEAYKTVYSAWQADLVKARLEARALAVSTVLAKPAVAKPSSVWCGVCKGTKFAPDCAHKLCKTCCAKASRRAGTSHQCAFHASGPA